VRDAGTRDDPLRAREGGAPPPKGGSDDPLYI